MRRSVVCLCVLGVVACGDDDGGFVFDGAPPPVDQGPGLDAGPRDMGGDTGPSDCPEDAVCVRIDTTDFPFADAQDEITVAAHPAWPVYFPSPVSVATGRGGETVQLRGFGEAEARFWLVGIADSRIAFALDIDELEIPDDLGRTFTVKFVPWLASLQVGRGGNMGDNDVLIFAALSLFDPMTGEPVTGSAATVTLIDGATETPMPFGRSQYAFAPDPMDRPPGSLRYAMRVESDVFAESPFEIDLSVRLLSGPATIIEPEAGATVPHDAQLRLVWGEPPDASYVIPCVLAGPDFSLDSLVWGCDQARFDRAEVPDTALNPSMEYRIGIQSGRTTSHDPGAVGYSVVDSFVEVTTAP